MHCLKSFLFAAFLVFSGSTLGLEPPTAEQIAQKGLTFQQLVELQRDRENLIPKYLDRRPKGAVERVSSVLGNAKDFWQRIFERKTTGVKVKDEGLDIMEALFDKVKKEDDPTFWQKLVGKKNDATRQSAEAYAQRKRVMEALRLTLGEIDNFVKDTEVNREVPDLRMFNDYQDQTSTDALNRFLATWINNLEVANENLELILYNFIMMKQRYDELNGGQNVTVNKSFDRVNDIFNRMKGYLKETKAFAEFERKCDPIRTFVAKRNVAEVVVLDRIGRNVAFKDWLGDFETFGPAFFARNPAATVSAPFLRWSLERFNNLTRANLTQEKVASQVDGAYRIFFIRLQIEDPNAEDFSYLVQQRQLARNGMESIVEAYKALGRAICSSDKACSRPTFSSLFTALKRLQEWITENPLEARIIVEEVNHAYSILAGSNDSLLSEVTNAFQNILSRRTASDFLKEVLYGDYQPIIDPAKAMPPEIIALTNLAPALPYIAAMGKGATGGGLLAKSSAFALSFTLGGPLPAAVVACATPIIGAAAGAIQTYAEKKIAKAIPNSAEANAVMAGLLRWANTGDIREALRRASVIYFARKGAAWFGNNCMEGGWVHAVCDASLMLFGPAYGWWTGDYATAGAMVAGYACVKYNAPKTQMAACSRANDMIAQIARNLDINGEQVARDARKSSADAKDADSAYQNLLRTLSNGASTAATGAMMDVVFSGAAFKYPSGIRILEFMAKRGG